MSWYVFALVDTRPVGRRRAGFGGGLTSRPVAGAYAIVERRADVPPVEFGSLKTHDRVVAGLAAAVPAILPVRFGALLTDEELEERLGDRDEELAEAFAAVRGRVQFTWRRNVRGARRPRRAAPAASGSEYLRRAARAAQPAPPAAFTAVRTGLRRFVDAERYQPATASVPDSLYHLVDRGAAKRYRLAAERIASTSPVLRVSGPFPPFAFVPEML